ncbi:kinase-like domain-containing protein [Suillus paluster]|uniref:kinase-like domain-containing protein n=1 Tax=Suillus paluster TaxID=48578 RepID=UPI001B876186|nr:kinase-like domain-containing protein [Suillus paluster]KAG1731480.1 kinase-like domain-containing protein [Suillus paluster]
MSFLKPASRKGSLPMTGSAPKDDTPIDFTSQISKMLKRGSPCATGSFGVVHRCVIGKSNKSKKEVAVKVFKIDDQRTIEKIGNAIHRELVVWFRLKHATIVPLLGIANVDSPFPALVSQWMSSGTLDMYLKQGTIALSAKVELAMGVAKGLKYLHSQNVIHGDLHPGNVLIDDSGNARLIDFGLATVAGDVELQLSTLSVNRDLDSRWRAPEVIGIEDSDHRGGRPTFKSDVYSFGGIMFFIISGDMPWKEKKPPQIWIALSKRAIHARPDNILDDDWDLIQSCWSWDAKDRPEAAEVIGQLQSTHCNILQIRSRFRVLVIGKTGVGKSSLVHQAFKIDEVNTKRVFFVSPNGRVVIHNSEAFEAGDSSSFAAEKEFVAHRPEMPSLKDEIHAIWCDALAAAATTAMLTLFEGSVSRFLMPMAGLLRAE